MAHINSTMNPLFYMCLNPAFLVSFRKLKSRFGNNKTANLNGSLKTNDETKSDLQIINKIGIMETTLIEDMH
jgi:hypothetical protein